MPLSGVLFFTGPIESGLYNARVVEMAGNLVVTLGKVGREKETINVPLHGPDKPVTLFFGTLLDDALLESGGLSGELCIQDLGRKTHNPEVCIVAVCVPEHYG
ncbi:hypothetical protein COY95_00180, partial [Candidatus Woesearchaeota archaeon CG_4_10_14_0_8_um_filter_47_5]